MLGEVGRVGGGGYILHWSNIPSGEGSGITPDLLTLCRVEEEQRGWSPLFLLPIPSIFRALPLFSLNGLKTASLYGGLCRVEPCICYGMFSSIIHESPLR